VRICLVYDLIYPHTVGGAERWYRNLGMLLASEGHHVDYLTLRHWPEDGDPGIPGVNVIAVGPSMRVYANGRRRIGPPVRFGLGVFVHLVRHGRRYDAVHVASFPYFSLLAAGLLRPLYRYRLIVDWHETWTRDYWRSYLGRVGGELGWRVQRLGLRLTERAFCFSQLHERRLREQGFAGELLVLRGQYAGPPGTLETAADPPVVVYAGRHIPEKHVLAIPLAIEQARRSVPDLRGEIFGDGPDRPDLLRLIDRLGLTGAVTAPGFVEQEQIEGAFAHALCLLLPSSREGYGLVVVEALSYGTPVLVVAGSDNAAVEFIEDGINGFIAPTASAEDLSAAILRIHKGGRVLRESTAAWFERNRGELSLESSLESVATAYAYCGALTPRREPAR
jgi:glycosyltransferase involved in cell wall biosynthesis